VVRSRNETLVPVVDSDGEAVYDDDYDENSSTKTTSCLLRFVCIENGGKVPYLFS
ncbi:unnamed protein product, partial [Rotaria socialis]